MLSKKNIIRSIIILFMAILLGFLLLIISYLIPFHRILLGCANSINTFVEEGSYPLTVEGYENSKLDNYSDGAMFNFAIYHGDESTVEKAVMNYWYTYQDKNPMESFISYLWEEDGYSVQSYSRYWHGFLVYLKPLLLFFDYTDIRLINGLFQILMICLISWQLGQKRLGKYSIPLCLTYFFLSPVALMHSLQYSAVMNVALFSTFMMLAFEETLSRNNWYLEAFLITGILTSYLDMLTYPLFSLGMPLVYFIIVRIRRQDTNKNLLLSVITHSISWAVGYIGMWAGKWLISMLYAGKQELDSALNTIAYRSVGGLEETENSVLTVIQNNLIMYDKPLYKAILLTVVLFCVFMVAYSCYKRKDTSHLLSSLLRLVPFLLIFVMPFGWYVVTANHAAIHTWFTCKTLGVSLLAFFSCILTIGQD